MYSDLYVCVCLRKRQRWAGCKRDEGAGAWANPHLRKRLIVLNTVVRMEGCESSQISSASHWSLIELRCRSPTRRALKRLAVAIVGMLQIERRLAALSSPHTPPFLTRQRILSRRRGDLTAKRLSPSVMIHASLRARLLSCTQDDGQTTVLAKEGQGCA